MEQADIQALIGQIDESSIQEFSFQTQTDSLYISKIKEHKPNESTAKASIPTEEKTPIVAENKAVESVEPSSQPASESVQTETPVAAPAGKTIDSPLVGVAYLAKNPDQPAFKSVGDKVEVGDTVCIVEAMKVMNEITADVAGTIANVLIEDGQVVEFGQPLFEIN